MTKTMQMHNLCLKLAKCNRADQVIDLLVKEGYWDNEENWRDIGDNPNNFATIGSQQSSALRSLIEKITNMGDSLLISKVREDNINPNDKDNAPGSVKEAMQKYLDVPNGDIYQLDAKQVAKLADSCGGVVVTGDLTNPTYAFFDMGEGQEPENFPTTFCGLSESNKLNMFFVQGKFCAGGSGALRFAKNGLQLFISRRSPKLNEANASNDIGFTVTRKFPAGNSRRNPPFKYLVIDGKIPSFPATPLKILPKLNSAKPFERDWEYGSFIKLFDYDIGRGLRSKGNLDLSRRLSIFLPNPVFPIRFYERRGVKANSPETTMSGLQYRLADERNASQIEEDSPFGIEFTIDKQTFKGEIYVLKNSITSSQKARWHKDNGLLYTVNGQVNGYAQNSIYRRKSVNLGYIADKIITLIDCSSMDPDHAADFFMADRERLINSPFAKEVEKEIEYQIGNHEGLKRIQEKHRRDYLQGELSENKALNKIMEKLLKNSPTLKNIFVTGQRISLQDGPKVDKDDWKSKQFPSYFKLHKKHGKSSKKEPRGVQISRKANFTFTTDAPNDYLTRSVDPGTYDFFINEELIVNKPSISGSNGVWHLNMNIDETDYEVGSILKCTIKITDIDKPNPLKESFYIKVNPFVKSNGGGKGGKSEAGGKKKGNKSSSSSYDIPLPQEVKKEDWHKHDWNAEDGFRYVLTENTNDIFVNMDNIYLKNELRTAKDENDREVIKNQFKIGLAMIAMNLARLDKEDKLKEEDADKVCKQVSQAVGMMIVPIIRGLNDPQSKT